jgi:hypothetical protein
MICRPAATWKQRLACVIAQPFGSPVLPEV